MLRCHGSMYHQIGKIGKVPVFQAPSFSVCACFTLCFRILLYPLSFSLSLSHSPFFTCFTSLKLLSCSVLVIAPLTVDAVGIVYSTSCLSFALHVVYRSRPCLVSFLSFSLLSTSISLFCTYHNAIQLAYFSAFTTAIQFH